MDSKTYKDGFIEIEDAINLINSNSFDKPTVDIKWIVNRIDWVELSHNFNIPRAHLATPEEYKELMQKYPGRKPSELIIDGYSTITVRTPYERELVKQAIKSNYRAVSGREFEEGGVRGVTTVKDQETGSSEAPRVTKKTIAKKGQSIDFGISSSTNSADGAGI